MKFGIFMLPYTLDYEVGKATAGEIINWDLQLVRWADEYGFSEAYFAEHYTIGREPSPAPDLMIAAASQVTKNIHLGAAAHLLPYHNPVSLAHRLMWLDHMTGGRYIAGIAPGAFPSDAQLFCTDGKNFEMMQEALEIILAIWTRQAPFKIDGTFWKMEMPPYSERWHGPHMKPLQKPYPRLAIAGTQPNSPSLTLAGKLGAIPLSQQLATGTIIGQWDTYSKAAREAGHDPRRSDWRIMRDIFIADTDEEARNWVINGPMGRMWAEHTLLAMKARNWTQYLAPGVDPDDVTVEYLADNFWFVGSPDTVRRKIEALYDETGGFGALISWTYDCRLDSEPVRRSLELLGRVVAPALQHLQPDSDTVAKEAAV